MESNKVEIQKRLENLLKKNNFTAKKLSEISGVSPATISQARSDGRMSDETARSIAKALHVGVDYLKGVSDVESPDDYALKLLSTHVAGIAVKSVWDGHSIVMGIAISEELSKYLKTLSKIEGLSEEELPSDLREDWLNRKTKEFIDLMGNTPTKMKQYVLLDHNFYTDEVATAIENAKKNMQGHINE